VAQRRKGKAATVEFCKCRAASLHPIRSQATTGPILRTGRVIGCQNYARVSKDILALSRPLYRPPARRSQKLLGCDGTVSVVDVFPDDLDLVLVLRGIYRDETSVPNEVDQHR
jgi:hypothetical protein